MITSYIQPDKDTGLSGQQVTTHKM